MPDFLTDDVDYISSNNAVAIFFEYKPVTIGTNHFLWVWPHQSLALTGYSTSCCHRLYK